MLLTNTCQLLLKWEMKLILNILFKKKIKKLSLRTRLY